MNFFEPEKQIPIKTLNGEIIENYEYKKTGRIELFFLYLGALIFAVIPLIGVIVVFFVAYGTYHKKVVPVVEVKIEKDILGREYIERIIHLAVAPPDVIKSLRREGLVLFVIGLFYAPVNMIYAFLWFKYLCGCE